MNCHKGHSESLLILSLKKDLIKTRYYIRSMYPGMPQSFDDGERWIGGVW